MNTYVALLRGINLGKHKRIKMGDLGDLFDGLGHTDVATYLQSGNVVFKSPKQSPARAIEHRIEKELGLDVTVILRTKRELERMAKGNPFIKQGVDVTKLHATFLADKPDAALVKKIDPEDGAPDEFRVAGRDIYLHCPKGYGRSKLNNSFWERRLNSAATTRNWKTVTQLVELAGS